jgi:hypothetical protein
MTDYSKMTDQALSDAIAAAEAAIRCPRIRGAFLDRMFASGDWSWTHKQVLAGARERLDLLRLEQSARASRTAA